MTEQPGGKLELHPEAQATINQVKDLAARAAGVIQKFVAEAPPCFPDEVSAATTNAIQWGHDALRPFSPKADGHADNAVDGHQNAATKVHDTDDTSAANIQTSGPDAPPRPANPSPSSGDPWNTSGVGSATK